MRRLKPFTALLLVPTLFLSGCGGASTPESAFEGFKTSMQNNDYKTGFTYLTPDSQEAFLTMMMLPVGMMKAFGQSNEEMDAVLKKHGIDFESESENPIANVKDKGECFQDLMNAMKKTEGADQNEGGPFDSEEFKTATLTDLKIDGTTATAMAGGEAIHFTQIDGKWLLDLKKSMEAQMGGMPNPGEMPSPGEMMKGLEGAGGTPEGLPTSLGTDPDTNTTPDE